MACVKDPKCDLLDGLGGEVPRQPGHVELQLQDSRRTVLCVSGDRQRVGAVHRLIGAEPDTVPSSRQRERRLSVLAFGDLVDADTSLAQRIIEDSTADTVPRRQYQVIGAQFVHRHLAAALQRPWVGGGDVGAERNASQSCDRKARRRRYR